ncbi:hypothetical protein GUJ93_ZPchr0011g28736 [Zizania palustris]|uniref:Uncharacterized protein n=1 Tax=Zizania palustris TaxID=103762 RepID=A0A8J5WGD3_ZIZPA|nr:hypothetical protein GUJ93_ZPchr0011g28736 [Zizania palustris]
MKRSNAMSSTTACSASQPVLSGDVIIVDDIPEPPSSKRKLNFGNEPDGACDVLSSTLSALVDNADSDEGLAQAFEDIAANQGLDSIIDIPTNDFYIAGPAGDFPQPLPSTICEVSSMLDPLDMLSSPAYQVNSQDTSDIMAKSTSEAELGMDFIEKAFQEATIKVLMGATEGLNIDTLRDPQCCARLENVSARLPSLIPGVDKAKELLLQLISVSQQLQLAHAEFESYSAQKRKELDEAKRELAIHEVTSENQEKEEISVHEKCEANEKLIASLTTQLNEAISVSKILQEEKAQFAHRPSEREANGKKWNEAIVEAAAGVEQAASNLQVKVTSCEQNVDGLLKSLKTWSATTN